MVCFYYDNYISTTDRSESIQKNFLTDKEISIALLLFFNFLEIFSILVVF